MNYILRLILTINFIHIVYIASTQSTNEKSLRIPLDNMEGELFSKLFEPITFIPLETNKLSLFGKIDQLEVTKNFFFILDFDTNCILQFDKSGKYISKIDGGKHNVNKFDQAILSFSVNESKSLILVNWKGGIQSNFNFDGKLLSETKVFKQSGKYLFPNDQSISFRLIDPRGGTSFFDLTWMSKDGIITSRGLPSYFKDQIFSQSDFLNKQGNIFGKIYDTDTSILFSRPYDYNIYFISPDSLYVKYKVILPVNYSLPVNFTYDPLFYNKRAIYLIRDNPKKVFSISSIYDIHDYLILQLSTSVNSKAYNLVYNKVIDKWVTLSEIESDENNFFFSTHYLNRQGIQGIDQDFIYSSIPANEWVQSFKNRKRITGNSNESSLINISKSITDEANPIIVSLRLKRLND